MKPQVNDELLDQLVCGTLRGPEYRKAILALEAQPDRWRDCALAFLQEQAIAQELTQLANSNVNWERASQSSQGGTTVASFQRSTSPERSSKPLSWIYKLSSLAAMLLISFSVGWIGSSVRGRSAQAEPTDLAGAPTTAAGGSNAGADLNNNTAPPLKLDNMTIDQVLPNPGKGSNNYSFVGNNDTSLMPIDEQIPPNLAKLEREGHIRIEKTTALMPVNYGDMTVLVPVQQLRVVPVTFSY
jgi:hypothetical protein